MGAMEKSFYFYDLETSGINPRDQRVMQFAGQRTDMTLKPIAEPDNILIKLPDDILPEPDAVLITGITPQATLADGITEYDFLKYFSDKVCLPGTIFVGFNNVRFDDEFIRFMHYRNFYDAYAWSWRDERSRWDLLDVLRLTRALRPDGITWPFTPDGKPTNRLELMTEVNGLEHSNAHDALSDVNATIAVARLVRNKQPKLFDYLLDMRSKTKVQELINSNEVFIYTSGRYPNAYMKTTAVVSLGSHPVKQGSLVYDLRRDPEDFVHLSPAELAKLWYERVEDETKRFPIKLLQYNRCPAVAPLTVVESSPKAIENIHIDLTVIQKNKQKLASYPDFYTKLIAAIKILDKQSQTRLPVDESDVDARLYDGFYNKKDELSMSVVRATDQDDVASLDIEFEDNRLKGLLPLYKARNFRSQLGASEIEQWEKHRQDRLFDGGESSRFSRYFKRLNELMSNQEIDADKRYLLEELQLYGESIMPDMSIDYE